MASLKFPANSYQEQQQHRQSPEADLTVMVSPTQIRNKLSIEMVDIEVETAGESVGGDIEDLASESGALSLNSPSNSPRNNNSANTSNTNLNSISVSLHSPYLISEECHDCKRADCPSLNPPPGYFSWNQVAAHNVPGDVWITAYGIVYDVSRFLKSHPGGEASLLARARAMQDASRDYDFHSRHGKKLWQRLAIGRLATCPYSQTSRTDCLVM